LLGERGRGAASAYHGTDGLGDVKWPEPSPSINQIHNEHAAIVINRLVDSNPGSTRVFITLIANIVKIKHHCRHSGRIEGGDYYFVINPHYVS